jgi:hypothetical protein
MLGNAEPFVQDLPQVHGNGQHGLDGRVAEPTRHVALFPEALPRSVQADAPVVEGTVFGDQHGPLALCGHMDRALGNGCSHVDVEALEAEPALQAAQGPLVGRSDQPFVDAEPAQGRGDAEAHHGHALIVLFGQADRRPGPWFFLQASMNDGHRPQGLHGQGLLPDEDPRVRVIRSRPPAGREQDGGNALVHGHLRFVPACGLRGDAGR